jgi:addiction module HigA family antidote
MINAPVHPGEILKADVLEPLGLDVDQAAVLLGVPPSELSQVLEGRADISRKMALGLEKAGISNAKTWVELQSTYSLHRLQLTGMQ